MQLFLRLAVDWLPVHIIYRTAGERGTDVDVSGTLWMNYQMYASMDIQVSIKILVYNIWSSVYLSGNTRT